MMPKILMIDVLIQQSEALFVEELLQVRAKVDALIQVKSYPVAKIWNTRSHSLEWLERSVLMLDALESWTSKEFQAQNFIKI
jgi:hypothetical protein